MSRSRNNRDSSRRTGGASSGGTGGVVADGDYGDVVVSGSGLAWAVDPALFAPVRREVFAAGHNTNDSATLKAIGNFVFDPTEYGSLANITFRSAFNNGNITVGSTVTLRNMTAGVDVCSFTRTGAGATGVTQQSQALTVGAAAANVLSSASALYEVRINVTAPALVTDVIEHWKSFLSFTS